MDPRKSQLMQMQRPSYRAVESIESRGTGFSRSVISIGELLKGISTFVINIDQTREILGTFGLFGGKKKKSSKSWVGESILGSGRSRFS